MARAITAGESIMISVLKGTVISCGCVRGCQDIRNTSVQSLVPCSPRWTLSGKNASKDKSEGCSYFIPGGEEWGVEVLETYVTLLLSDFAFHAVACRQRKGWSLRALDERKESGKDTEKSRYWRLRVPCSFLSPEEGMESWGTWRVRKERKMQLLNT